MYNGTINNGDEPMTLQAYIPFAGFYHSVHDDSFDRAIEMMYTDDAGDTHSGLVNRAMEKIDWREAHILYAKEFVERFAAAWSLPMKFAELVSPREYNFTTDRILVNIDPVHIRFIRDNVDADRLAKSLKEKFTSRDGFISFYSPDLADWPEDVTAWDANQLYALIDAYTGDSDDSIMEDIDSDGTVYNIIDQCNPESGRMYAVFQYLYRRKKRR
jgi:hypothetical protein